MGKAASKKKKGKDKPKAKEQGQGQSSQQEDTQDHQVSQDENASKMGRVMRAIRVAEHGGPEVLKVEKDVPVPEPKSNEVLLKVASVGINPMDAYIRAGHFPPPMLPPKPYTPGGDCCGTVEAVGNEVTKFKAGDRVYTAYANGSYAEYTTVAEAFTFPMTDSITLKQGAAIGSPYFTAYRGFHMRGQAKPGESVLIHGASGAVGSAATQIARAWGCRVFGTAGTADGLKSIKDNGCCLALNHRDKDYVDKIKEETGGVGVDLILEMKADANLEKDINLLAPGGRVVVFGAQGPTQVTPLTFALKEIDVRGVNMGNLKEADCHQVASCLMAGMETGWVKPVVGQEFSLEDASKSHIEVLSHAAGTKGKIILVI